MKLSREIVLLRAALAGASVKFIELTQVDGDKTYVNPDDVSFLERGTTPTNTRIQLKTGKSTIVTGTPAAIRELLEQD